ncbi:hypothetical protein HP550_14755 [Cellulomonas humilata]|uniref:DUF2868 domain-containing protein n=1 Tax=Cellulomonas humilata TaxID=144055 RepID=A0A7Y6A4X8_9CELL|nr:hypothetical protein [Cellulomonas humilata]NUU18514.1 hypothetical protein [Cellulomonas humilata]
MSVKVVYDVLSRGSARSASASAASVAGVLLMGVGIAGLCVVFAVSVVFVVVVGRGYAASVVRGMDPAGRWSPDWLSSAPAVDLSTLLEPGLGLGIGLAASLALLWLGLALLRRRRHAVLFLRRFGYDDATRIVTAALTVLGRSWRVVTLDDSDVQAVGARRSGMTLFSRSVAQHTRKVVGPVMTVGFIASFVVILRAADTTSDPTTLLPAGLLDASPLRIESGAQLATAAVLLVLAGMLLAWVLPRLLFPAFLLSERVERSAQAAEGAARQSVQDAGDVATVGALVERMTRRVFSPQLMVVASTNALWRATVSRLLAGTEVTLVDVSRPTESLLWEIRELTAHDDGRCVYIGHVDRLARFLPDVARTAPPSWHVPRYEALAAAPSSVVGRIEQELEGHEVLAYSSDPATVGQFSRSLERYLWNTVTGPAPVAGTRPRARATAS